MPPQECPIAASRPPARTDYDVIVIGAGHAGVEAAWAAARMGRSVAICTLSTSTVALMPCNPGGWWNGEGSSRSGDRRARRVDGTCHRRDRHSVQTAQPQPRSGGVVTAGTSRQAGLQRMGGVDSRRAAGHLVDHRQGRQHPHRRRPRRRARAGDRRALQVRLADCDHRHVPQWPRARGPRSAPGRTGG